MRNGETVRAFESAFADYVGAKYAIALANGTCTLHTALVALGVKPGDKVATTPLTMSATSIAILQAGAVPTYHDVDERTWLMAYNDQYARAFLRVSLYGLHFKEREDYLPSVKEWRAKWAIDDAAQTLRPHSGCAFTSYSFQASKILALGEGGMLVTDSEELATKAREFSSLGYRMKADQPRIDPSVLKNPSYERHHTYPSANYRMNDLTAAEGLRQMCGGDGPSLSLRDGVLARRRLAASFYRQAIEGCSWITPQYVPEGWAHDYWTFAIALESKELWKPFTEAIVRHGGEMPYGAWRLSYDEPAFRQYRPPLFVDYPKPNPGLCPIAESLQPRLVQFQTNDLASAERNAKAVKKAIGDIERGAAVSRRVVQEAIYRYLDPRGDATGTPCS